MWVYCSGPKCRSPIDAESVSSYFGEPPESWIIDDDRAFCDDLCYGDFADAMSGEGARKRARMDGVFARMREAFMENIEVIEDAEGLRVGGILRPVIWSHDERAVRVPEIQPYEIRIETRTDPRTGAVDRWVVPVPPEISLSDGAEV